jgi:hypothetical protein
MGRLFFNQNIIKGFIFHLWKSTFLYQQICVARASRLEGKQVVRPHSFIHSFIHSFCSLSYDRSVVSPKASSPQGVRAISDKACVVVNKPQPQPHSVHQSTLARSRNKASRFTHSRMRGFKNQILKRSRNCLISFLVGGWYVLNFLLYALHFIDPKVRIFVARQL